MIGQYTADTPTVEQGERPRWRPTGPLEGWRDDAPELLPSCCLCGEPIAVGQHYAVAGVSVACLACSRLPTPIPPLVEKTRALRAPRARTFISQADRRFAGERPRADPAARRTRASHVVKGGPRVCGWCGASFPVMSNNPNQKSCSKSCAQRAIAAKRRGGAS